MAEKAAAVEAAVGREEVVRARAVAARVVATATAMAANMDQKPGHCKSLGYLKQAH